jgi:hypothetical protein
MNVVLDQTIQQKIHLLGQKHRLTDSEVIAQAIVLMEQADADWEAIFTIEPVNQTITEEEAFTLAVSEVRQHRNAKI